MDQQPNYLLGRWLSNPLPGEEVVITGMAGRLPESNNIYEFRDNLFNKKDMVTADTRRWAVDHPEIPQRSGKIYNIDKFDSGFFGLHYRQAHLMDPMMRKFMEVAVEAVMDAGVNPSELEGSKTGVYIGGCNSDLEIDCLLKQNKPQNFGITGYLKAFNAHRVSYHLKLKGPSAMVDTACSSSANALDMAFQAIRSGYCDNALVGGINILLHPGITLQFYRLGVLSDDGKCKVFDEDASGYVKGETIACLFLQKAKNSRRIYGQVIYSKLNDDGFKSEGITFPSAAMQEQLITEMFTESGITPSHLSYLEAHGTGTPIGDPEEVKAIDRAVAKKRDKPLLIGSVKSSIGHTEAASGVCALIKVLIAMETGKIPPNIHLNQLRKDLQGFDEGRLKVVTEVTKLECDDPIIGINNFGFGGNNCHVIVRRFNRTKINGGQPEDDIPRLVCVSGRTHESIVTILDNLNKNQVDGEYVGLLHQLFKKNIANHLYRGYIIISKKELIKISSRISNEICPVFIVFGKFDNSFKSVGRYLLDFPVFKTAMLRVNNLLLMNKINIIDVIFNKKTNHVDNVIGEVAVLIGIADMLKALELDPVGVYGKSVGKLIKAYFEEIITLEETILKALKMVTQTPDIMTETDFDNILTELKQTPAKRHHRYFINGDKNETENIREDSLNLESFGKRSIVLNISDQKSNDTEMPFSGNNSINFLETIGRLYEQGHNPQLHKLYPEIQYPVSRGTPMISPFVKWDYNKTWKTYRFSRFRISNVDQQEYNLSVLPNQQSYISGHVIDGRNLVPAIEYLHLVWQTFMQGKKLKITAAPIIFQNCKFIRASTVPKDGFVKLLVTIQKGSGDFEVIEKNTVAVTGRIMLAAASDFHQTDLPTVSLDKEDPALVVEQDEFYRELYLRGYNYSGLFKGIVKCNVEASNGLIRWENNWVTFMDKMLQMKIMQVDTRFLYVPTSIEKLIINPVRHLNVAETFTAEEECIIPVHAFKESNLIRSGGIEIWGLQARSISRRKQNLQPVLEKYEFVPNEALLSLGQSARVNTQIILESSLETNFKAVEIVDEFTKPDSKNVLLLINEALEGIPLINPDLTVSTNATLEETPGVKFKNVVLTATSSLHLIVGSKLLQRSDLLKKFLGFLHKNGFVLTREDKEFVPGYIQGVEIVTQHTTENEKLILLRRTEEFKSANFIEVSSQNFDWLHKLQTALKTGTNVMVYAQHQEFEGIIGFINCLRREPGGDKVRCFFTMDEAPKFDPQHTFYQKQIKRNFAVNIYKNSKWGTYRHLLLEDLDEVESDHCYADTTINSELSSLKWLQGPLTLQTPLKHGQCLVYVYYTAINFKDIMLASGRINIDVITNERIMQDCVLGFEFSGKDLSGNLIAGMTTTSCLSTIAACDLAMSWPVPETWSLEEAATFPTVYGTVIYAFTIVQKLKRGCSILIHSAAGGIGIAAINVALYHDCEIFVTVGTRDKRNFLKTHFPQIKDSHIGNSRDTTFEEMIKLETRGRGVDVVLNSLTDEKLKASIRCLTRGGRFLEIGKFDLASDTSLSLLLLEKEITYYGVMLDKIFNGHQEMQQKLHKEVSDGIRLGYVKPLPTTVYKQEDVEKAFRFMTTGKHIGKILIKIRDEKKQGIAKPFKTTGIPRFHCTHDKSYIIIGGLGGFGLELADWLVLRGAKKLILVSRSEIKTGYPNQRISIWRSYGVTVQVSTADVTTEQGCLQLINESASLAPVDGIFNLAVVLKDALFGDQTAETFHISFAPKADATTHLNRVSREHCPNLSYFVIFSSVSCGRGNPGQTNYGMANSVMERICEKRKRDGLPALAIQWGAIGEVGLVAKMQKENRELVIGGTLQQKVSNCFEIMDKFLKQNNAIVSSMVVAEKYSRGGSGSAVEAIAYILGIKNAKNVNPDVTLAELGMDSITGTEVMQLLEKDYEIYVSAKDIRSLTFEKLLELEAEKNNATGGTNVNKTELSKTMLLQYLPNSKTSHLSILRLPSLVSDDEKAPTVFVLPGLEGVFWPFESLAKNLKAHVLGVPYSFHNPEYSVQEMAENILPHIEENISKDRTFHIISYSFGVIVALEIVARLEAKGFTGDIIAIDGAPAYVYGGLKEYLPSDNQAEFETLMLCKIAAFLLPLDVVASHKDNIFNCTNFDERVDMLISLMPLNSPKKQDLGKQRVHTTYKRFDAIRNYEFTHDKIKSPLHLFKAKYQMVVGIENDYKLSELCEQPVQITVLDADHVTILKRRELTEAINKLT